jgi:hypothetical protein
VLVVEPARIAAESPQGLRALYVAMTRATRRLAIVHSDPLPVPFTTAPGDPVDTPGSQGHPGPDRRIGRHDI